MRQLKAKTNFEQCNKLKPLKGKIKLYCLEVIHYIDQTPNLLAPLTNVNF